ncbi:c-type cytochrome domain-containing protein [uncultured Piscinibacter sp.]|uniref:c-type cytochrome domain-containing protein n=1 Tax=uncultured Piscinibacter sp. TaxID=1131835 RepID=UPI00261EF174|nr:c-type cytochrome domain-containing protein [uncultured Piscinibacter sp.]
MSCRARRGRSAQARRSASDTRTASRALLAPTLLAVLLATSTPVPSQGADAPTYADLSPLLVQRCVMCHGGNTPAAGLRLDSLEAVLRGSARGPVVKSGEPAGSELIRRLKGISQPRMPMTGPPFLTDQEIAQFERWIAGGLQGGKAIAATKAAPTAPAPGEPVTYLHVAPILATRCAKCHTDSGLMGAAPEGYRLTSHASTLSAADRVRVVPGHPAASELVRRIRGQARPRMPFDGPPYLSGEEVRLIEAWISQGARDAAGAPAPVPVGARVRLHGTLGTNWQLDDLPLAVTPSSRIDGRAAAGSYTEVRGRVDEGGRIVVDRLRSR